MLHPRAFKVSVVWTLGLLFLGSVVHATESSLACPDWPTCFGTMVPEMTGGVFWEHLHRLVAGGLVLMFALATWLVRKEAPEDRRLHRACYLGLALLVVQSIFGGLTVLYRLPDMVSTTHLGLAFLFLALATWLASLTWGDAATDEDERGDSRATARVYRAAVVAAVAVFIQSVVGALVRHTDGGMSCPDFPLCLGQVVPPLVNIQITSHYLHRVVAVVVTGVVVWALMAALKPGVHPRAKNLALLATALLVAQVSLGIASVLTVLSIPAVSLHTLVAAMLLASLVAIATLTTPGRARTG